MVAKRFVGADDIQDGTTTLVRIVSMLFGLIRANSDVRIFEEPASYRVRKKQKAKSRSKNRIKSRKDDYGLSSVPYQRRNVLPKNIQVTAPNAK